MKWFSLLLSAAIVFALTSPASAASPTFYSGGVSAHNLTPTSAALQLVADSKGQPMRGWFEVSTTRDMSAARKVGDKTVAPNTAITADVTGLTPGTTYYLRAVAKNYDGETLSDIVTFKTPTTIRPPNVEYTGSTYSLQDLTIRWGCDGNGAAADCSAVWSTSPSMSGEQVLVHINLAPNGTGSEMRAVFPLTRVPDNTKIYVQATIKTSAGTAKTPVKEFVIHNKPL